MQIKYLLVIFLSIFTCFAICKSRNLNEDRLKNRVKQYYDFIIHSEYEKAFEMWTKDITGSRQWSKEVFIDWWENKSGRKLISIKIDSIEFDKEKGISVAYIHLKTKVEFPNEENKNNIKDIELIDIWVYQNKDWYRFEQD
jgi:hypothetical protein